jgi:hypothetical protein
VALTEEQVIIELYKQRNGCRAVTCRRLVKPVLQVLLIEYQTSILLVKTTCKTVLQVVLQVRGRAITARPLHQSNSIVKISTVS